MAQFVCEQLEFGRSVMVEAPTGVGKSLALLLPAIAYALQHDKRVVVSTYTVLLAEQYWGKDLPLALELFPILVRSLTRTRRWKIGCVLNRFNPIRAGKPSTWGKLLWCRLCRREYMPKKTSEGSQQHKAKSPFEKLRTTGSSAYRLHALVAFYTHAKKPLFDREVTALFAQALPEVCQSYEYELIAYRVMSNQLHLLLGIKPTDAIADVVSNIKRSTARRLFEGIPRLEEQIGKRNFWAEGYFTETLGHLQIEPIIRSWQQRSKEEGTMLMQIVYDLAQPLHPKQIERVMDELLPAERAVVRLLYGLEGEKIHTLDQAAEKLGLKPHEVNQIAQESIAKIRAVLRERRLERAAGRLA